MTRPRINRERNYWEEVVKEYEVSQQTKTAFCRKKNIAVTTFYGWLQKIKGKEQLRVPVKNKFEEILLEEPLGMSLENSPYCEIRFSEQDKIIINSQDSLKFLKGLMQCLK